MTTNTPTNADEVLRGYLLGTLPPETLEGVEQRLFSDDRVFWERLSLVEEQLVDDYAWDRLGGDDREGFERRFLTTAERRAKLEFARAFRAHLEQRKEVRNTFWQRLRGPVALPGWAVAAAAVLLLAVLPGLTWQIATNRTPGGATETWLESGQVRDVDSQLTQVRIEPGSQIVRLQLELETAWTEYSSYSVTLFEVVNEPRETLSRNLVAGNVDGKRVVTLTLPAEGLLDVDYYVVLQGSSAGSEPQTLGRYPFRVVRKD